MNDIIYTYPKTIAKLKAYYLKKNPELERFMSDDILRMTIKESPYSILEYFDTLGRRGTLSYDYDSNCFRATIEGDLMEDENGDYLESPIRNEAITLLVMHLFKTTEKTL